MFNKSYSSHRLSVTQLPAKLHLWNESSWNIEPKSNVSTAITLQFAALWAVSSSALWCTVRWSLWEAVALQSPTIFYWGWRILYIFQMPCDKYAEIHPVWFRVCCSFDLRTKKKQTNKKKSPVLKNRIYFSEGLTFYLKIVMTQSVLWVGFYSAYHISSEPLHIAGFSFVSWTEKHWTVKLSWLQYLKLLDDTDSDTDHFLHQYYFDSLSCQHWLISFHFIYIM